MQNVSAQGVGTQEFDCKNAIGTATDVHPPACLQPVPSAKLDDEDAEPCTVKAKNAHEFILQCTHVFPQLRVKRD